MRNIRPKRDPWELNTADFYGEKVYASRSRRYELFFDYLRISPSYAMAVGCSSYEEFVERLGDDDRARRIWAVKEDFGDVFQVLFKDWWKKQGLSLFGVHSQQPKVNAIARLNGSWENTALVDSVSRRSALFLFDDYTKQGRPDSIVFSVPLGQKRNKTSKELNELLRYYEEKYPPKIAVPKYQLIQNRIQDKRLILGIRFVTKKATHNGEENWRIAARSKISRAHAHVNPNALKKCDDPRAPDGRRALNIIAARLYRETMLIAENAALGSFPSLEPINVLKVDFENLKHTLDSVRVMEINRKMELMEEARRKSIEGKG
jgi:hypothetical protein